MAQYDDVADRYERLVAPKYLSIAQIVADHAPPLAGRDVLEVGAGTGLLTRLLAPRGGYRSYVASDVSAPMLAVAASLVDADVEFVEADIRKLPLEDAAFDLVIGSLTPLQEVEAGFTEARRVLRPNGELLIGFWGDVYAELELLDEVRRRLDLGAYARDRERSALALAASAGFEAPTVTVVRLPVHHASVDAYLDYRASFGRLAFVPEDRQDEWVAMLREVSKERQGPDGAIDLDWTIALLHATSTG
jgi:SAM-dependent methyltransferase